jgi:uncharacterized protein (DUF1499 family)
MLGFVLFAVGGLLAVVVGIASIVQALRGRVMGRGAGAALVVGVVFLILAGRSAGVPAINDFTTDPGDPPAFRHATTLAANVGRDMSYPAAFAATQRSCCADLRPARLPPGREEAFARARTVAERMPSWRITAADPEAGTIEAVETSRLFGFQDDIVIRVRANADGSSRVDVRSKSRDGRGDLGVNAARIRAFVAALETAAAP